MMMEERGSELRLVVETRERVRERGPLLPLITKGMRTGGEIVVSKTLLMGEMKRKSEMNDDSCI